MRRWIVLLAVLTLVPSSALMQEKGGEDEFGPYEVVENWPQPIPGTEGYTWGSTGGVFAETPDRIWIGQRGMLALPAGAKFGVPLQGQATAATNRKWMHCIFVVDRNGRHVQSWTQHDKIFEQKGARGPHKIKMNPYDPQKHVWVFDDDLHQLFKFSYDGKLVQTWGEAGVRGEDASHFGRPTDIDWLPDGTFFVSDGYTNTRVVKFSPEGKYLTSWGTSSTGVTNPGPNQMHTVHSVAVGRDRKVYVSDRTNSRIQIFDENGKFLDMWTNIRRPYHVLMTPRSAPLDLGRRDAQDAEVRPGRQIPLRLGHVRPDAGPPQRRASVLSRPGEQPLRVRSLQRARAEIPPAQGRRSCEADRTRAQARGAVD